MTVEIRFYHLLTQSLEQVLPAILMKALSSERRMVVRFQTEEAVHHFDDLLWVYTPDSFLPHGLSDRYGPLQPVLLTTRAENPNNADTIILCGQEAVPENIDDFSLCCDFLDGQNERSIQAGRARWKAYQEAGHAVTYWQQTESGGWEQKS